MSFDEKKTYNQCAERSESEIQNSKMANTETIISGEKDRIRYSKARRKTANLGRFRFDPDTKTIIKSANQSRLIRNCGP